MWVTIHLENMENSGNFKMVRKSRENEVTENWKMTDFNQIINIRHPVRYENPKGKHFITTYK